MKCPYCGKTVSSLDATTERVPGAKDVTELKITDDTTVELAIPQRQYDQIEAIILTCPHCQAILGAVNKPKD